jgi:hypothetical protein
MAVLFLLYLVLLHLLHHTSYAFRLLPAPMYMHRPGVGFLGIHTRQRMVPEAGTPTTTTTTTTTTTPSTPPLSDDDVDSVDSDPDSMLAVLTGSRVLILGDGDFSFSARYAICCIKPIPIYINIYINNIY